MLQFKHCNSDKGNYTIKFGFLKGIWTNFRTKKSDKSVRNRVVNRIKFHFPVSECYNRVDNRIGNIAKIIG